jgi:hypothetical protein
VRVLRAVGAVPVTGAAGRAAIPAARTASAPAPAISGTWTELGIERPAITVVNDSVLVDMSFAGRPDAMGKVLDATRILVTFPDAGTFLGVLRTPTFLCWSNGSSWQKVFTDPQIFDLAGRWVDRSNRYVATIGQSHGCFTLGRDDDPRDVPRRRPPLRNPGGPEPPRLERRRQLAPNAPGPDEPAADVRPARPPAIRRSVPRASSHGTGAS